MPAPIIGITISRNKDSEGQPRQCISEAYVEAVSGAGGVPVLVPLGLAEEALEVIAARLDGILFSGGGDMEPSHFAAPDDDPRARGVDPDRDRVELDLFRDVLRREMPFLGICRGFQVINVALGGSLYVDIKDELPGALHHPNGDLQPRDYLAHPVQVSPGSRLRQILKAETVAVNSMHHQGVNRLASRLAATAHAPDGLIEAFEMPDHPFGLAVQWHPECLPAHEAQRGLFRAFIEAAGRKSR
jgi:putative glutamine amidotransferase